LSRDDTANGSTDATKKHLTSVVIVAADSGLELLKCVECVLASSVPIEVVVSDNSSSDGSIETLSERWPNDARLHIVRNGKNLGFGTGCNRGAAIARGEMILFLNPDCRIQPDTIERLCHVQSGSANIGVVGANICAPNGTPEPASRRRDPILRRALMSMFGLARFELRWPVFAGANLPPRVDAPSIEDVDAVSGALMLLPRAVFDLIGGFDEIYFLHCEDLDICRRVRDQNSRVVCANDVVVVHVKGTSSRTRPFFVARHKHRGMWRWFLKFDPAARNPVMRAIVWCGLWAHFVLLMPRFAWLAVKNGFSDSD
jgi:GT2 family glycosyltransferase